MIYDLVIIGGGINGVAIARDAALRGLSVCLFEKSDFGSGASTKTSKLAHGGLRYLESLEIGLVRESLQERTLLLKNASHLVKPLPFILPVYIQDRHPLWKVNLGLYLYDFFARKGEMPRHCKLAKASVLERFPTLAGTSLQGGCLYYDALMKDNRLLIETLMAAEKAGAAIFNYTSVVHFLYETPSSDAQARVSGVVVKDKFSGLERKIAAKIVLSATGAWSDQVSAWGEHTCGQVLPTKGTHIVVPQICQDTALLLLAPQDGRAFFVLPWEGKSLVGTTDTFYKGNLDYVEADMNDVDYLLEALKHHFPGEKLSKSSVESTFAGLRPLFDGAGHGAPSEISRRHRIERSPGGVLTVFGGKYTTHRKIAEETVDRVIKELGKECPNCLSCQTAEIPLPGVLDAAARVQLLQALIDEDLSSIQALHLIENYGKNSWAILEIIQRHSEEKQQICPFHPHLFAELSYAIASEHVKTADDWFYRRTSIAYSTACKGEHCREKVMRKLNVCSVV